MGEHAAASGALDFLNCELAAADAVAAFAPILAIPQSVRTVARGEQCEHCCHWSLPLNAPYRGRDTNPAGVAMYFHEWLTWHFHVIHHQRLDGAELVA